MDEISTFLTKPIISNLLSGIIGAVFGSIISFITAAYYYNKGEKKAKRRRISITITLATQLKIFYEANRATHAGHKTEELKTDILKLVAEKEIKKSLADKISEKLNLIGDSKAIYVKVDTTQEIIDLLDRACD